MATFVNLASFAFPTTILLPSSKHSPCFAPQQLAEVHVSTSLPENSDLILTIFQRRSTLSRLLESARLSSRIGGPAL
eukprot:6178211-Pleurochrysis_carterae.AAC.2